MTNSEQARPEPAAARAVAAEPARRASVLRTSAIVALAAVAGAAVGALALYGMNRLPGNDAVAAATPAQASTQASLVPPEDPARCATTVAQARKLAPFATGELAALTLATTPKPLPELAFTDAAGKTLSLADFKGRVLLVNLWATWCVPCRKEMPELDHLQAALGGPDFAVVAINLDTRDPEKPRKFLSETGVTHLGFFADPKGQSFQALRAAGRGFGLPTTLLVDREGCELGFLAGPAAWGGSEAQGLVRAAIADGAG